MRAIELALYARTNRKKEYTRKMEEQLSRYFKLTDEQRQRIKDRARNRYQADPSLRKKAYLRCLPNIKKPKESTLNKYDIPGSCV